MLADIGGLYYLSAIALRHIANTQMPGTLKIILPTGESIDHRYETKIPPTLEDLQLAVGGGYVEHIKVRLDGKIRNAYVDEDGHMKALTHNRFAQRLTQEFYPNQPIVGILAIWIPDPKVKNHGVSTDEYGRD